MSSMALFFPRKLAGTGVVMGLQMHEPQGQDGSCVKEDEVNFTYFRIRGTFLLSSFSCSWGQMDFIVFVCFLVRDSEFLQTQSPPHQPAAAHPYHILHILRAPPGIFNFFLCFQPVGLSACQEASSLPRAALWCPSRGCGQHGSGFDTAGDNSPTSPAGWSEQKSDFNTLSDVLYGLRAVCHLVIHRLLRG